MGAEFSRNSRAQLHFGVASINEDGSPHVTPIGSLVLGDEGYGVYFERYPTKLPQNLRRVVTPSFLIRASCCPRSKGGRFLMKAIMLLFRESMPM
jgi:hypothetical protein